ncbi:MAG: hypothetical protein R3B48_30325 [Kofleriaceae bacterium]
MPKQRRKKPTPPRSASSTAPPAPTKQRQLFAVLASAAAFAVVAGGLLAVKPTGELLALSSDALSLNGFESYRVPGLLLALLIGGTQARAALSVMKREAQRTRLAVIAGAVMIAYVAVLALALRRVIWLQPVLFGLAAVELILVAAAVPRQARRR